MKKLLLTIPMVLMFNACSKVDGANPSQNEAVNKVAGTKTKKPGAMQNALDNWLNNEWNPSTSNSDKPTANTKVKVVENKDGSAKLIEIKSGETLKEISKEEVIRQKEVKAKYQDKDRAFTLQEYVDKAAVYNSSHIDKGDSHTKKINSLPVIGTRK